MTAVAAPLTAFLLANLLAGIVLVVRGPTTGDRLLAVQLFGTTGVAVLAALTLLDGETVLLDVALTFSALAAVTGAAFVARAWGEEEPR